MRTPNRGADRTALRALYLQILESAAGIGSYNSSDDANLDLLDGMVAGIYERQPGDPAKAPTASVTLEARPVEPALGIPVIDAVQESEDPHPASEAGTVEPFVPGKTGPV